MPREYKISTVGLSRAPIKNHDPGQCTIIFSERERHVAAYENTTAGFDPNRTQNQVSSTTVIT